MKYIFYIICFIVVCGHISVFSEENFYIWLVHYKSIYCKNIGMELLDVAMIVQMFFSIIIAYVSANIIFCLYKYFYINGGIFLDVTHARRGRKFLIILCLVSVSFLIFDFPSYYISNYQLFFIDEYNFSYKMNLGSLLLTLMASKTLTFFSMFILFLWFFYAIRYLAISFFSVIRYYKSRCRF